MVFGINSTNKAGSNCTHISYCLTSTRAITCQQHLPLVVLNVSTANTMNTAALQQSMCQASILLNNLDTATELLLQHTASAYTVEDTEHLCLSLLVFCQQVALEEHASGSYVPVRSELCLLPNPKCVCAMFLWQPIRLVLHIFHNKC